MKQKQRPISLKMKTDRGGCALAILESLTLMAASRSLVSIESSLKDCYIMCMTFAYMYVYALHVCMMSMDLEGAAKCSGTGVTVAVSHCGC